MSKHSITAAAALALGVSILGCEPKSAYQENSPYAGNMVSVASSEKGGMVEAPMDDTYTLFSNSRSVTTVHLKKGDMMGFKTTPDGKTMAVAGDRSIDVTGNKAMWLHGMSNR